MDTVRWVLSTLIQGSCAVYGLLVVYYVYQRGKSYEAGGAVPFPHRIGPTDIDGKPTQLSADFLNRMGQTYSRFAEIYWRDKVTVWQLVWFSTLFVSGMILGVFGLIWYEDEALFWIATICLTGTIVVIGASFLAIALYVLGRRLTVGYAMVEKGRKFYEGEYEGQSFPIEALRSDVVDKWKRRTRWSRVYPAIFALVLLAILLSVLLYFVILPFFRP
jgi:hypothetical protein